MVDIKPSGDRWVARIDCDSCGLTRIQQAHHRSNPRVAVEASIKTIARTLGWKVGSKAAICGRCRRKK